TVSRVFTNSSLVAERTRNRVLEAAERLNYRPNRNARTLRRGKSDMIGALYARRAPFADSIYGRLLTDLATTSSLNGQDLVLIPALGGVNHWRYKLTDQRVDGVLVVEPMPDGLSELLRRNPPPMVLLNLKTDLEVPTVTFDDVESGRLAARHLIDLGHRRLLYILQSGGSEDHYSRVDRLVGIREVADARPDVKLEVVRQHEDYMGKIVDDLAARPKATRPTGVIVYMDDMALDFHYLATQRGLSIPRDLSVVGFNNDEFSSRHPILTSVSLPIDEMAEQSLRLLNEQLELQVEARSRDASNEGPPVATMPASPPPLQPTLINRASSGPPPDAKR
ncbi:MAG: LacI family DNA-binding transcriptional regulator, partial [Planctomycetota bacterium]